MNENSGKKRREWVKNAAIIFLSVMLVLTFFSNTFMNYSLPEVAAQYVQSGTITAKIRGTGTVESGDPYNVKISETRTISSVLVKTGDKVEKGDPLFLLEDKESKELTDAQAALDKAMLDFELALLSGDISNSTFQNVQNGNVASINTYQSRIVAAEAEIDRWQKQVDEATNAINQLKTAQVNVDADKANAAADSFDGSSISYRTVFGNAAFVGDSVMTGFDVYMGLPNNVNVFAEVGAFMDKHLPAVIDSVIARYPKYVFVRYGINEMGTTTAEADAFASRYKGYIQKLKNNLPDAKIVVLGIAPVGNAAVAKNSRFGMINEYNTRIKAFCQEIGVAYYENSELFISNASLYSKDGIHFSKELYQKWVKDIIRKVGVY